MARDMSSGFSAQIDEKEITLGFAVKVELDSGDIRIWSGLGDLTFDGELYLGAGELLGISPVSETQAIEARAMSVTFSGIPATYVSTVLSEDYQGRPLTLNMLAFDGSTIYSIGLYKGLLDIMELQDDGTSAQITATVESDISIVTTSSGALYTPENQKALFPNDEGLDGMPISADVEITWGQT